MYNLLDCELTCPHCGNSGIVGVELFFGFRNLNRYKIGSLVEWIPLQAVQNGGRPPDGNLDGEGYVQCPFCEKDYFVIVITRVDRIEEVKVNLEKPGHIK